MLSLQYQCAHHASRFWFLNTILVKKKGFLEKLWFQDWGRERTLCYAKRNYSKIGKNMKKTEEGKKTKKKKRGNLRMIPLSKSGVSTEIKSDNNGFQPS